VDPTEETDAIPLTFEEVQDEHGNDLLVARDRAQMSPEERARSRDNIHCLVEQLRATARPIHQPTDG
jgi:hypothetical protein